MNTTQQNHTTVRKFNLLMKLTGLKDFEYFSYQIYKNNEICFMRDFSHELAKYLVRHKFNCEVNELGHVECWDKRKSIRVTLW